jgi:hypothetical protein
VHFTKEYHMSLSVFDQFGNVDQSAIASNEVAIEALAEPARKALFDLIAADQAARDGDARLTAARKDLQEKSVAHDRALDANNKLNKPMTHQEALLDVIAVGRGEKPAPRGEAAIIAAKTMVSDLTKKFADADEKAKPKIKAQLDQACAALASAEKPAKAKEALHRAIEAVALARAELTQAISAFKQLEIAKGNAVLAWMNSQTDKPTALDIARASAKADADRRHQQNLAAPAPKGPKEWPLEVVMKNRGNVKRTPRQYLGPRSECPYGCVCKSSRSPCGYCCRSKAFRHWRAVHKWA